MNRPEADNYKYVAMICNSIAARKIRIPLGTIWSSGPQSVLIGRAALGSVLGRGGMVCGALAGLDLFVGVIEAWRS